MVHRQTTQSDDVRRTRLALAIDTWTNEKIKAQRQVENWSETVRVADEHITELLAEYNKIPPK